MFYVKRNEKNNPNKTKKNQTNQTATKEKKLKQVFQAYGMTYISIWGIGPQMQETMVCSGFKFKKKKTQNSKYSKFIDGTGYYALQHLTQILLVAILNASSSRYTVITPTHVMQRVLSSAKG